MCRTYFDDPKFEERLQEAKRFVSFEAWYRGYDVSRALFSPMPAKCSEARMLKDKIILPECGNV